jgi:hypothetical protein
MVYPIWIQTIITESDQIARFSSPSQFGVDSLLIPRTPVRKLLITPETGFSSQTQITPVIVSGITCGI